MSLHVLAYNVKRVIAILGAGPLMQAIRPERPDRPGRSSCRVRRGSAGSQPQTGFSTASVGPGGSAEEQRRSASAPSDIESRLSASGR
jgi:hypothetical protein